MKTHVRLFSLLNRAGAAGRNTMTAIVTVANAEVGRIADGKWTMFGDALKAFKGSVESVALWTRKLSDAEVLAAFSSVPHVGAFVLIVR